ncbi:hypothetical protein BKA61DRAFT_701721 [Leptodontidium sp. MPI-SDFR-AT-0119]|nr:hypothetical protein BKA61DRAFT_701721 [Leptodontidium sp. MPI-SDFR-AT-0119]
MAIRKTAFCLSWLEIQWLDFNKFFHTEYLARSKREPEICQQVDVDACQLQNRASKAKQSQANNQLPAYEDGLWLPHVRNLVSIAPMGFGFRLQDMRVIGGPKTDLARISTPEPAGREGKGREEVAAMHMDQETYCTEYFPVLSPRPSPRSSALSEHEFGSRLGKDSSMGTHWTGLLQPSLLFAIAEISLVHKEMQLPKAAPLAHAFSCQLPKKSTFRSIDSVFFDVLRPFRILNPNYSEPAVKNNLEAVLRTHAYGCRAESFCPTRMALESKLWGGCSQAEPASTYQASSRLGETTLLHQASPDSRATAEPEANPGTCPVHGAWCSVQLSSRYPSSALEGDNTSSSTTYDTYLRRETLPPPTPKPIQSHDLICYQSPGYEYGTQQSIIVGEGGALRQHLFTNTTATHPPTSRGLVCSLLNRSPIPTQPPSQPGRRNASGMQRVRAETPATNAIFVLDGATQPRTRIESSPHQELTTPNCDAICHIRRLKADQQFVLTIAGPRFKV